MKIIAIPSALFLVACLSGCGPYIDKGVVTDKSHRSGYSYPTSMPMGKMYMTTWHRIPESWSISYQSEMKGVMVNGGSKVSKDFYERVQPGDFVDCTKECIILEAPDEN